MEGGMGTGNGGNTRAWRSRVSRLGLAELVVGVIWLVMVVVGGKGDMWDMSPRGTKERQ